MAGVATPPSAIPADRQVSHLSWRRRRSARRSKGEAMLSKVFNSIAERFRRAAHSSVAVAPDIADDAAVEAAVAVKNAIDKKYVECNSPIPWPAKSGPDTAEQWMSCWWLAVREIYFANGTDDSLPAH